MKYSMLILLIILNQSVFSKTCEGHFVNPVNLCWRCLFPISIGNLTVVDSDLKDTPNPSSPIGICGNRVGLNIGFWEPFSLVDVTDTPYCLVNLGGHKLNLGVKQGVGGAQSDGSHAFYHVHWYKYPLLSWLNIITSMGCQQGGDFDVAYMSELDPSWQDSKMGFVLNPEAFLFANPVAQASCAADSVSTATTKLPIDALHWCAGSHGSMYPLNGHVAAPVSPVQSSLLLASRMNYKLHRFPPLISDTSSNFTCEEVHFPVLPKSRYRYEMVNQVQDGNHCYPLGHSTLLWEAGKIKPNTPSQYGYLVWRKRNCTFL